MFAKGWWYDDAIFVEGYAVHSVKMFAKLEVLVQFGWETMAGIREPRLDGGHEFTHGGVTGGGKFDCVPSNGY